MFAPTDAAFAKVPKKKLNALLRSKAKLRAVLLYHVAAGKLTAADVVQRSSVKTLNGKKVRIRVRDSNVFLNRAKVTTPDVIASTGSSTSSTASSSRARGNGPRTQSAQRLPPRLVAVAGAWLGTQPPVTRRALGRADALPLVVGRLKELAVDDLRESARQDCVRR